MSTHSGPTDISNIARIVQQAVPTWSKHRCWHGEDVEVTVLLANLKEGSAAELHIFAKGNGALFDKVKDLKVQGGKVKAKYKIDWKEKVLPKQAADFVVKVVIGNFSSAESHELRVDLEPPVFSA